MEDDIWQSVFEKFDIYLNADGGIAERMKRKMVKDGLIVNKEGGDNPEIQR